MKDETTKLERGTIGKKRTAGIEAFGVIRSFVAGDVMLGRLVEWIPVRI